MDLSSWCGDFVSWWVCRCVQVRVGAMEEEAERRDAVPAAGALLGVPADAFHRPCHPSTRPDKARRLGYKAKQGMRVDRCIEVWKMGTVSYSNALKLQEKLLAERKAGNIADTLLSLQHPPTYTLGKRRTYHNLLVPEADLKSMGAELHYTERGGDVTFHGPRQAVLYPIISLRDIGYGARKYVESLELAMIKLASLYGVEAYAGKTGEVGVWVENRKIGAVGVRISSGFTTHGLAFNIDPDLNYFKHIVPCGIADKEVTSLKRETDVPLPADDVIHEQLVWSLVKLLGFDEVKWKENPPHFHGTEEMQC